MKGDSMLENFNEKKFLEKIKKQAQKKIILGDHKSLKFVLRKHGHTVWTLP